MLVTRTKKSEDARPKRTTSVSGPRVLPRTNPSFVRATRMRESGEGRRATQTVEESIKIAHEAVQTAQVEQERLDTIKNRNAEEHREFSKTTQRLNEARRFLGIAAKEKVDVQREFRILVRARDRANTDLAKSNADLVNMSVFMSDVQSKIDRDMDFIEGLEKKIADRVQENTITEQEKIGLEEQIRILRARTDQYGKKIDRANKMHRDTLATIEESTASFRVFEQRIAHLSEETGYTIGYKKLKQE